MKGTTTTVSAVANHDESLFLAAPLYELEGPKVVDLIFTPIVAWAVECGVGMGGHRCSAFPVTANGDLTRSEDLNVIFNTSDARWYAYDRQGKGLDSLILYFNEQ